MQSLRRHPGRNRLHPTHQIALAAQTLAHLTLAHLTLAILLRQTLATLSRSRALGAQTIAILLRRQFTSNPFRGESLFASTEQPVYRLEPPPEEGEPRGRWSLS